MFIFHFSHLFIVSSAGPGPVDSPTVSGLHPRSVTVTWVPPSRPNGIINTYTLYLWPGCLSPAVSSSDTTLSSCVDPTSGPLLNTAHLGSDPSLRPTSHPTPPGSGHISKSAFSSNTIQSTKPNPVPKPFSSLRPLIAEYNNTNQGLSSLSLHHNKHSSTSVSPSPSVLVYTPDYHATSVDSEQLLAQDPFQSPTSSSFSEDSGLNSSPLFVTVPGNTTNFTFLDLLPYHTYSLQVPHSVVYRCVHVV